MTSKTLDRIRNMPRIPLLRGPTPLDHAPNLSKQLGIELFIKRDDLTPIGAGGNKLRKLEFIVAAAIAGGVTALVTTGGVQSNHARLTAAVAARLDLKCYLRLKGRRPEALTGNVLLDHIFGANIDYWDLATYDEVNCRMKDLVEILRARGEVAASIPLGGATPEGTMGYALAFAEICGQFPDRREPDYIVLAAGTGSTQAGLLFAVKLMSARTRVLGVSVSWTRATLIHEIARHVCEAASLLDLNAPTDAGDIWIEDGYVGEGYGLFSRGGRDALMNAARLEGILLDSTYTAKGLSGLVGEVDRGTIARGSRVVFIHSGGTPEIYSRPVDQLLR